MKIKPSLILLGVLGASFSASAQPTNHLAGAADTLVISAAKPLAAKETEWLPYDFPPQAL